uniref:Myelin and lymphocyte protein n=1 Tax=Moschus moschiferus TaxID=68415 RepID=A0A8C6CWB0_MOSMO
MATGTAPGGGRLTRGSAVFTTFPDLLFIFEFVSGRLVWLLILLTQVPVPLVQGRVLFVSVFCFTVTTLPLLLYIVGAHKNWNFWITLDTAYHCLTALFHFSASALETLVTIGLQDDTHTLWVFASGIRPLSLIHGVSFLTALRTCAVRG